MTHDEFQAIIKTIEQDREGDGYHIRVHIIDGDTVIGAWSTPIPTVPSLIKIEYAEESSVFIPLSSIVAIEGPLA